MGIGNWAKQFRVVVSKEVRFTIHALNPSYPLTALLRGIDKAPFSDEIGLR